MNKFSLFVPADGMRDAFVAYMNDGVTYLIPVEERITVATLPADSSDDAVCAVATVAFQDGSVTPPCDALTLTAGADGAYPMVDDAGVFLGWDVVFYDFAPSGAFSPWG